MARYRFPKDGNGITKDANGRVLDGVTVSVFLTGTATPAKIYAASVGGVAIYSVVSDTYGSFGFYMDDGDYGYLQGFDITYSKTQSNGVVWNTTKSQNVQTIGEAALVSNAAYGAGWSGITDVAPSKDALYNTIEYISKGITEVYPEWYGAIADNSTDCTAAIQAALDSLTSGGIVQLSQGIYRFTNLTITNANTTFQGSGWGSVLATTLSPTAITVPPVWVQANGCTLKDFKVTWVTMPASQAALATSVEQNDTIAIGRNYDTVVSLIENVTVDNVYVYGAKQHGISIGYSNGVKIGNNKVEEFYGTGIFPFDTQNIKITDNFIYRGMDTGIDLQSGTGRYADNAVISNNIVHSTSIGIGSHGGRGATISDNVIDNTWASAIYCQLNAYSGVAAPFITNVTGNVIRRPFQFYGGGNFHALDWATTVSSTGNIIEVLSTSEVNIANNIINDDSGLQSHSVIGAYGTKVTIVGNTATSDGSIGLYLGPAVASDYTLITSLAVTGNNIAISSGNGANLIVLNGVGGGTISGNDFDCGAGAQASPNGRFATMSWTENIVFTGNRVTNFTDSYVDNGNNLNIVSHGNNGVWGYSSNTATTAQLEDKTHAINTTLKIVGKPVWNTTTGKIVYAYGTGVTGLWLNDGGLTEHTPI